MEIRGKAPLRVSLTGGGTDLNYVFEKIGGAVTNMTINKYCHMGIRIRDDDDITVNGRELDLTNSKERLAKAIVLRTRPKFGFDLTYHNDIPPGSGLGSSSSFNVLMLRLLAEAQNRTPTDLELISEAHAIDVSLKEGGWQDQYATALGGFNFMEFGSQTTVYPLRLRYGYLCDLMEHMTLVKIGEKDNEDTHQKVRIGYDRNATRPDIVSKLVRLKDLAYKTRDCLLNGRIAEIGPLIGENWEIKRNPFTTTPEIDKLYDTARKAGATGGKLCGSGKAGHFLLFAQPSRKPSLLRKLQEENYEVVPFDYTEHGVETWRTN